MMLGRVGDGPLIGCGFYAGSSCAVAATGIGEVILKRMLARHVYDIVSCGESVDAAAEEEIRLFPPEMAVGIIALSQKGTRQHQTGGWHMPSVLGRVVEDEDHRR